MKKPYKQIAFRNYILRYFPKSSINELYWHRDKEDRSILVLVGNVNLQLENELPIKAIPFKWYKIPKETFHRVIFTSGFLVFIRNELT